MTAPAHLSYNNVYHVWWEEQDGKASIGITKYQADGLGEILYAQLPNIGAHVVAGDRCGGIELSKAAIDVITPVSGEIVEVNEILRNRPDLIRVDPYGEGWLFRILVTDVGPHTALTAAQYEKHTRLPRPRPC